MTNQKLPQHPTPRKDAGDFNRRYAVPLILVGSVLFTLVIIIVAGIL